jgi:hypothetical protein
MAVVWNVGAAEGCDLLIFGISAAAEDQKIAGFASSYTIIFSVVNYREPGMA